MQNWFRNAVGFVVSWSFVLSAVLWQYNFGYLDLLHNVSNIRLILIKPSDAIRNCNDPIHICFHCIFKTPISQNYPISLACMSKQFLSEIQQSNFSKSKTINKVRFKKCEYQKMNFRIFYLTLLFIVKWSILFEKTAFLWTNGW